VYYLGIGQKKTPGPKSRPTIRSYTAKLLVRPPEKDFDFGKFLLFMLAIGSLRMPSMLKSRQLPHIVQPRMCVRRALIFGSIVLYTPPL
jgi:hypothetical protein